MPHLAHLPSDVLGIGTNTLTIHLSRDGGFRIGYLAPAYIGSADEILPNYRVRSFLVDQQRITVPALYALLTLGVAGLWFARRHDHIYGWYSLMGLGFTLTVLVSINPFHLLGGGISSIVMVSISNFSSIMVFGLACVMTGKAPPRFLIPLALLLTGAILAALMLYPHFRPLGALFGLTCLGWFLASVIVLIRAFRITRNMEHALTALGVTAVIAYGLVDIASISGLNDRGILLLLYPQIFLIMALAVILFRRFAISLNMIDNANATLRLRLDEQEAALAKAHAHETRLTVDITREEERKRLTRDLHDGLSGHIISIIAQAEEAENSNIEKTAREAMDDLRLVIQSFEIGGEDMPVVLAYFRERTTLQLRRLGIALDWSMDHLPTISGVTPGHALTLLRILQEAVTNAIKHGPARHIAVTGDTAQDGLARITIENDGRNDPPTTGGNGLGNMRQRASSLGGEVTLEPLPAGMRLTLILPICLPSIGREP